jgi:hypothetical protein
MKSQPPRVLLSLLTPLLLVIPILAFPHSSNAQPVILEKGADTTGLIPIEIDLEKPSYVTLVIDDKDGKRVRNLISETLLPAGKQTIWWDGAAGADTLNSKGTGLAGPMVEPGNYTVRGIIRDKIELKYEFTVYNPGTPPWSYTENGRQIGRWLADHVSPTGITFLPNGSPYGEEPQMLIVSPGAEWGDGLVWLTLDGRKLNGRRWIGGTHTAAMWVTQDRGPAADPDVHVYTVNVAVNAKKKSSKALRLMALMKDGKEKRVLPEELPLNHEFRHMETRGLAAYNGIVLVSLHAAGKILIIDAKAGSLVGEVELPSPTGLAFDPKGRFLLAGSGKKVVRYDLPANWPNGGAELPAPRDLITSGLDNPNQILVADDGTIYVSNFDLWGDNPSQQVKAFDSSGKLVRTYGKPGTPQIGRYDESGMRSPAGIALAPDGTLWVVESYTGPRRFSLWNKDGSFQKAFYGPTNYGGGGVLSPDLQYFYYDHKQSWSPPMEFKLDFEKGNFSVNSLIYDRPGLSANARMPGAPQYPILINNRRYLTNVTHDHPTAGAEVAVFWLMGEEDRIARPVAAVGSAPDFPPFKGEEWVGKLPASLDLSAKWPKRMLFIWTDENGDGSPQPNEVVFDESFRVGKLTLSPEMELIDSQGYSFKPTEFNAVGAPVFKAEAKTLVTAEPLKYNETGSGGNMVLRGHEGWIIQSDGPLKGYLNGKLMWTYPNEWPSLHASHDSPPPRWPGDIIGGTRVLGPAVFPEKGDAGSIWFYNGNYGAIYAMTSDGLFVASVTQDQRRGKSWPKDIKRGDAVSEYTNGQESFWPSVIQAQNGNIYMVIGGERSSIARLDGVDTIRRIPPQTLAVTGEQLIAASQKGGGRAASKQETQAPLKVSVSASPRPTLADAKDWENAQWAPIEENLDAAAMVAGDRLHVALRTSFREKLENNLEDPQILFKTGAALDLMISNNPKADPSRTEPVAGDQRILVTRSKKGGEIKATLYQQVDPSNQTNRVEFSSGWRNVFFDRVEDITDKVQFPVETNVKMRPIDRLLFEFSVPLEVLGLNPSEGATVKGDIGFLRGPSGSTVQRLYWNNKNSGLTADVPGEAMLTPMNWGVFEFHNAP